MVLQYAITNILIYFSKVYFNKSEECSCSRNLGVIFLKIQSPIFLQLGKYNLIHIKANA